MQNEIQEFYQQVNHARFYSQIQGYYESFFLRANHPTRPLAFWIRMPLPRKNTDWANEGPETDSTPLEKFLQRLADRLLPRSDHPIIYLDHPPQSSVFRVGVGESAAPTNST